MDVAMKRVDGFAATKQITQAYPAAKVIIVTNHTDEKTRLAASEAGACAFCGKDDLLSLRSLIHSIDGLRYK